MTEMTLVRPLRADERVLRRSLLDALGLSDSDLSTDELKRRVEQQFGEIQVVKVASYRYLELTKDDGTLLLYVPLRRQP